MRFKSVRAATTFTYFPALADYHHSYSYTYADEDIELTFETPSSGTFVIVPGEELTTEVSTEFRASSPQLSLGSSIQIVNEDRLYHEISLTRLALQTDEQFVTYAYYGSSIKGPRIETERGVERRSFATGLRYELGRYLKHKRKRSPFRFALGLAVETSYFYDRIIPLGSVGFPWRASLLTTELAIVPTLGLRLSDKVFLETKLIPNLLLAKWDGVRLENPILTSRQREAVGLYESPQVNMVGSLVLRYEVKPAEKRRYRRRSNG
jgi:hypothetical protein